MECLRKKQELADSPVKSGMEQEQPVPCYSNNSLESQQSQSMIGDFEMPVPCDTLDCYLGINSPNSYDNTNFNITSDSTSLEIVENLIQQQQQPLPFFDNQIVDVNNDENGILPDEIRDFSMLEEIFFGSPMGDELTNIPDIPLSTSDISDQNQFAIGGDTMGLASNNIFSPELNMQFR